MRTKVYERSMGMTAHLELFRSATFDPGAPSKLLFSAKSRMPFAWFLFFEPANFASLRSATDKSEYTVLKTELAVGIELARTRLRALEPLASKPLFHLLQQFVDVVARAGDGTVSRLLSSFRKAPPGVGKGTLVLNSHRLEATKAELTAPLTWLASIKKPTLTAKQIERFEELFDETGITFPEVDDDDDDDELAAMELSDADSVTGWSNDEKVRFVEVAESDEPVAQPIALTNASNDLLAAVLADPDSVEKRLVYADALTAIGDARGEFITLQCLPELTAKQERRCETLWKKLLPSLSAPFAEASIEVERGFPSKVTFSRAPRDIAPAPEWPTVHTVSLRGAPALLNHPALARVRRVILLGQDVAALGDAGRPVPFTSLCIHQPTPEIWKVLESEAVFPSLIEVWVDDISVWLPPGAKTLLEKRPGLRIRGASYDPHESPIGLTPMTADEHAKRVARWTEQPSGPRMAGARYDNQ